MPAVLGTQTVTLYRRSSATTDAYGQEVFTETAITVTGCSVQPAQGNEALGMRDVVTDNLLLFAPAGTTFAPLDRVSFNGQNYEVDGSPNEWPNFLGQPNHSIVRLRKVTG